MIEFTNAEESLVNINILYQINLLQFSEDSLNWASPQEWFLSERTVLFEECLIVQERQEMQQEIVHLKAQLNKEDGRSVQVRVLIFVCPNCIFQSRNW